MNLKNKLEAFISKGFTYNEVTGVVLSHTGLEQRSLTGRKRNYLTLSCKVDNQRIQVKAHQFAWFYIHRTIPNVIDHIDRNTLNNRIENLRSVTSQQNSFNTNSKNYAYHKRIKKWSVYITVGYKRKHIGYFDTEEEAKEVAIKVKKQYHKI